MQYHPMVSLRDGHLAAEAYCYDFSIYDNDWEEYDPEYYDLESYNSEYYEPEYYDSSLDINTIILILYRITAKKNQQFCCHQNMIKKTVCLFKTSGSRPGTRSNPT